LGLAFMLAARGKDRKLSKEDIMWLVGQQFDHLEMIEFLKQLEV
jgi:hypothetical protein